MAAPPDPDVPAARPLSASDTPPGGPVEAGTDPAASTANLAWPRLARMDDPPPVRSWGASTTRQDKSPSPVVSMIIMQVCGLGLLLGGYFLGQAWAPKVRAVPQDALNPSAGSAYKAQRAGGERALDAANQALKAEKIHDLLAARNIYEDMLKRQAPMPGAEYRLALLSLHQGDPVQADVHLTRSIKAGDAVADASLFRASLAAMRGNFAEVASHLAVAVRAEPFSGKLCFCWGEALRRDRRLPEAVQRLTQALDRPDNATARALYLFKLRLAKIEAGSDPIAEMELDNALGRPGSGGEWMMLGAAREIIRKDYASAAEKMQTAKNALPADLYRIYVQDFFFQARRAHPELASLLTVAPPAGEPTGDQPLQDPAAWTAAEADPAVWPPFPTGD